MYCFVYGTLKRGFPNAHLMDGMEFVGEVETVLRYPLVGGAYFSPYLLDVPGRGCFVKELYKLTEAHFETLDRFEKVESDNYTRKPIQVKQVSSPHTHQALSAFTYLKNNYNSDLLDSPHIPEYLDERYIPRHLRPGRAVSSDHQ